MTYLKDDGSIDIDRLKHDARRHAEFVRECSYIRKDGTIDTERMLDDIRDEVCWNASFGL